MRKLILLVLTFTVLTIIAIGCAPVSIPLIPTITPSPIPATATPETASSQQISSSPISIVVSPFYSSEGTEIQVGNYSDELGTSDVQELVALGQEMSKHRDELTPEQMFVLAIRFYDLGDKNNSLYWFYEAQFRAKLFLKTLDPAQIGGTGDLSYSLLTEYDSFTQTAGQYINGYAGCNVDNWVKIAKTVQADNPTPPELDKLFPNAVFVEHGLWQGINDEVAAGLGVLIEQLAQKKDAIRQDRLAKNLDARYCN